MTRTATTTTTSPMVPHVNKVARDRPRPRWGAGRKCGGRDPPPPPPRPPAPPPPPAPPRPLAPACARGGGDAGRRSAGRVDVRLLPPVPLGPGPPLVPG